MVITPVLVDYITVAAEGPMLAHGFDADGKDAEGWRAYQHEHATGRIITYASLSGEECAMRKEPMARWHVPVRVLRLDVTRDITGLLVQPGLRSMFAGTRLAKRQEGDEPRPNGGILDGSKGSTVYIGSPSAPMMLRIYTKNDAKERLRGVWRANGWNGEPVTRVEYQCRTRQVRRAGLGVWNGVSSDWRPAVEALWDDARLRIRMCATLPSLHRQANEAPTHPLWNALEANEGARKLQAPPEPPVPPDPARILASIARFVERGGDPRVIERGAKMVRSTRQ